MSMLYHVSIYMICGIVLMFEKFSIYITLSSAIYTYRYNIRHRTIAHNSSLFDFFVRLLSEKWIKNMRHLEKFIFSVHFSSPLSHRWFSSLRVSLHSDHCNFSSPSNSFFCWWSTRFSPPLLCARTQFSLNRFVLDLNELRLIQRKNKSVKCFIRLIVLD